MNRLNEFLKTKTAKRLGQLTLGLGIFATIAWARVTEFSSVDLRTSSQDTKAFRVLNPSATPVFTIDTNGTVTTSGGGFSLANSESLNTDTDAVFDFTRDDAGVVTITSSDDDSTAALTIHAGGNAAMILGSASDTLQALPTTGLSFSNAESVSNGTDGSLFLGRNDAGVVTLTAKDDDATAALTVLAGGAAALTLGGTSGTSIQMIADNDVTIRNGATGSVTLDYRDYADTTDDDMAHAIVTVNCTDATTGAEDCDYSVGVVEAGAAAETRLTIDADGGLTLGSANNNSLTVTTDSTQDAEVTLPENSIGPDEIAGPIYNVILCGELTENGTGYFGPSTGDFGGNGADLSIGSTACDALDSTTEATADAPILTNTAFKVLGGYCKTDGTLGSGETLVYTVRSAAAGLTPALTCTISEAQSDCRILTGSTTDIAAGATIAVQAVETSNNADDNGWCSLSIALK